MLTRLGLHARLLPPLLASALVVTLGATHPTSSNAESPVAGVVAPSSQRPTGLERRIERLGVVDTVTELPSLAPRGARFFRIWFSLPVDHERPNGRRFRLRATLLHRGTARPTVLASSGYGVATWHQGYQYEVTQIIRGNQLDLEHRFFRPSRPARPDWATQLTIRQAAADQHLIVRALKRIYDRRWISTGHSKGGMTMTYQRRFYPRDVDGTVAYVAPNDAVDSEDVYDEFQAGVGGAPYADCRAALVAVQRRILQDRGWFRSRLADRGRFAVLGGPDRALEVAVIEIYFAFWQYQDASVGCDDVPGSGATRRQVWSWVDGVFGWSFVSDAGLRPYTPYYFQAATELGAPAPYEDPVADLLHHPGHDVAASFVPDRLEPLTFHPEAMAQVDDWVRTSASRMLFVYGEYDPWSAEPFECGPAGHTRQCYQRWVPSGNHGARLALLPGGARRAAVARVRQWAGVSTTRSAVRAAEQRSEHAGRALGHRRAAPAR